MGGNEGVTEGKVGGEEGNGDSAVLEVVEEPRGESFQQLSVPIGLEPAGEIAVSRGVVTAGVALVDGGDWW